MSYDDLKADNDALAASTADLNAACAQVQLLVNLAMLAAAAGKRVTQAFLIANGVPPVIAAKGADLFDVAIGKARGNIAGA